MLLNKFFHHCPVNDTYCQDLTYVLVPEVKPDGSSVIVTKVLETLDNPFAALTFEDFSIQNCIRNGVSYGALGITKDMRLGYESQFDALEKSFNDNESKFFVQPSNPE